MITNSDPNPEDILPHYQAPPLPPQFEQALLQRMESSLPRSQTTHTMWWILGGSGIAAAAFIVAFVLFRSPPADNPPPVSIGPIAATPVEAPPPTVSEPAPVQLVNPANSVRSGITGGALREEDRIARASLIVRARIESANELSATYTITRIIYGQTDEKTLVFDQDVPRRPELTPVGKEVILYLTPASGGRRSVDQSRKYLVVSTRYDSPSNPLDNTEAQIISILQTRP